MTKERQGQRKNLVMRNRKALEVLLLIRNLVVAAESRFFFTRHFFSFKSILCIPEFCVCGFLQVSAIFLSTGYCLYGF